MPVWAEKEKPTDGRSCYGCGHGLDELVVISVRQAGHVPTVVRVCWECYEELKRELLNLGGQRRR
jgi:hypothetical protein